MLALSQRHVGAVDRALRVVRRRVGYVFHPQGVRCIECGFLAFGTEELITFNRALLHAKGAAGLPDDSRLSHICCFKSLWVPPPMDGEGILDEIGKRRRPCKEFFRYRPGYSPLDHRILQEKKQDYWEKTIIGFLSAGAGAAFAVLTAWLRKRFGL